MSEAAERESNQDGCGESPEEPAELPDAKEYSRFLVNRVSLDLSGTPEAEGEGSMGRRSSSDLLIDNATYEYDTRYSKSLGQLTREVSPRADYYQDVHSVHHQFRPTMEELHEAKIAVKSLGKPDEENGNQKKGKIIKFGWFEGVYMRCLLNIWGVMLFLRLSWVVGQAGLVEGLLVIILANVVTTITAVSMSAVSTNGQIKGGGIYYLISRSLGPEFGGAIGLMFTLANSIAVAMYIVGFCESLRDLVRSFGTQIIDDGPNDIRAVGVVTVAAILVLALVGMDWVTRMQLFLLGVLVVSQLDFMLGTVMGPKNNLDIAKGFVGYQSEVFLNNLWSSYRPENGVQQDFFSVFAVFFPAVTGIVAGANLSGDLKDPSRAIPLGTLLAILTTSISYLIYAVMIGGCVLREASGNVTDISLSNVNIVVNITSELSAAMQAPNSTDIPWGQMSSCAKQECSYGLLNDYQAMGLASAWEPLIYGGCFAATLSSAIASLVGAPRVLQALASDRLYPLISIFGRGWGANNDPIHGYFLVFMIAVGCILIAELNAIAPLLSNFFLAAYALINFSVFHATASKCPGWRPSFKYYNSWVSLIGCMMCVFVMFLISWWTALITLLVVITLYLYVSYRKPDVNWGSSTQAQSYLSALKSAYALNRVEDHVKNFRPQLLVLCGAPCARPPLLDFANLITRGLSLLVVAQVLEGRHSQRAKRSLTERAAQWLHHHKVKAFFCLEEDDNFEHAVKSIIQICGLGKLRPNVLLMGYKNDWRTCGAEELRQYFHIIHYALDQYMAVGILRVRGQLDFSDKLAEISQVPVSLNDLKKDEEGIFRRNESCGQFSQDGDNDIDGDESTSTLTDSPKLPRTGVNSDPDGSGKGQNDAEVQSLSEAANLAQNGSPASIVLTALRRTRSRATQLYSGQGGRPLSKEVVNAITQFQRKQKKGHLDVWWLYDDGGLTLLLPHILSTRPQFSDCKLRVFSLANKRGELNRDQRNLAGLLSKFRIQYSDVIVIPDITRKAQDSTRKEFEALLEGFRVRDPDDADIDPELRVTDSELVALREKTNRHMRLREELLLHSKDSTFVVMTLPMPRKGTVSAPLYMAWLELLTRDMPPYLIVRGNQSSVLTFYS